MVKRAVAVPFNVGAEGLTPQLILLEEVAHDRPTTPLKLFKDVRFRPTVPDLPGANVI